MKLAMKCIYLLKEPTSGAPRYVGQTDNPKIRLNFHVAHARRCRGKATANCGVVRWILELLDSGLRPVMEVIEDKPVNADAAEQRWIKEYRERFCDLLNVCAGGRTRKEFTHSEETKQRMRLSMRGKKKTLSEEQRRAIVERVTRYSREHWSHPEHRIAASATSRENARLQWAKRSPEQRRAIAMKMVAARLAKKALNPKPEKPKKLAPGKWIRTPESLRNLSQAHLGRTQGALAKWSKPGEKERMSLIAKKQMAGNRRMAELSQKRAQLRREQGQAA